MKLDGHNELLDCWDPSGNAVLCEPPAASCPLSVERAQTGLCGEAQADGVPCVDPTRLCEACGRAH